MTRVDKLLRHIDKKGRGVEIGPCHSPVAPKKAGFDVHVIDYLGRDQLVEKYADHNHKHPEFRVDLGGIEDVDFVWNGEPYGELTGRPKYYDWVIASHVIEHVPDLVGFLNNCDALLKDDGVLSLAVPDHRRCFDTFRPVTGLARVVDVHLRKDTAHSPGAVAEYGLNIVTKGGGLTWGRDSEGGYEFFHPPQEARDSIDRAAAGAYVDIHAWCFTPHSFRLILSDLHWLGFIPLREVAFAPTEVDDFEFFVTLGRQGQGPGIGRLEMLQQIKKEESEWAWYEAEQRLAALHQSLSWRLTAPVRRVHSWLRGT